MGWSTLHSRTLKQSIQSLHSAVLDAKKHSSKSQCQTISLGSLLKAVVLRDARRDYSVGIPVLICAILPPCTMQFVALTAVQEQRKAASMSVRDLAEIYASQNAKSYYSTSLYHVDISPGSWDVMRHRDQRKFAVRSRLNKLWSIATIKSEYAVTNCLWK